MKKFIRRFGILALLTISTVLVGYQLQSRNEQKEIYTHVLDNGLKVLVRPVNTSEKVAIQLWVDVGSKDEKTGEKGLAHLIEHMIFKGTKKLSEADIPLIAHKLSGDCNASTYYDFTFYRFNMPVHNWQKIVPIMADCLSNCTFKQDLLNSELKAVVQELKMRNDNYGLILSEKLMSAIFADHPYHYPIIGFKQDLWNLNRDALVQFYKKHYVPNNATFVVVGNVDPNEVFQIAQKEFGHIPADPNYKKEEFYLNKDIVSQTVTLFRDINQSTVLLAYVVPGLKKLDQYPVDVLMRVLVLGKSSRLHTKLVDELQLVSEVSIGCSKLSDHSLFEISFEPREQKNIEEIIIIIQDELNTISKKGIPADELEKAVKQMRVGFYQLMESNYQQAYIIGKSFLTTDDPEYLFKLMNDQRDLKQLQQDIQTFLSTYCRPCLMHKGILLPLKDEDKDHWLVVQQRSDEEDARILDGKIRESQVEPPQCAHTIIPGSQTTCTYPQPQASTLKNGIKVFYHNNPNIPILSIVLTLKADNAYDSDALPGLYNMVCSLMYEGTQNYPGATFAQELEKRGISLGIHPGSLSMTMLSEDLQKGIELLYEVLTKATFEENAIEKIRQILLHDFQMFKDDPVQMASQLVREQVYKNHPYSKNPLGNETSLKKITQKDIKEFYTKYFSPDGARISIVGDLNKITIASTLERTLGSWNGPTVQDITYPELKPIKSETVDHYINRDQIVLYFAGLSVDRKHTDYDKLLLFDQIFSGGMESKLYELRRQTGAFYVIQGSVLGNASKQPGVAYIVTIVSPDKLHEVEKLIHTTIDNVIDTITQEELKNAKNKLLNSPAHSYARNNNMAQIFLYLDKYDLPFDYFEKRTKTLATITLDEVKSAAKKILRNDTMALIRVGRVGETKES